MWESFLSLSYVDEGESRSVEGRTHVVYDLSLFKEWKKVWGSLNWE